jgi:rhodanese-related sulfurtransferase
MSRMLKILLPVLFTLGLLGCVQRWSLNDDVPRITKEELKAMLGNPEVVIIDVRAGLDWTKGDVRIKGAFRENPGEDVHTWAGKYSKDKTIVLYCA